MNPVLARGLAASLLMVLAFGASAQEAEEGEVNLEGLETAWHIVRPGENLIGITRKYLGSSERWRDNWRLNPALRNPHLIKPGTRIRIALKFETAPPVTRVKALSGRVEERAVPIPWNDAQVEDLLVEKDGLRTYRNSSTELEFQDGTDLLLSEQSLVFVRPSQRTVTGPLKRSVEIVEGQAEVQALAPAARRVEIEIVVGSATATARQTEQGRAQTRARRVEDGSARVMVYEGTSEVEAAGQSVEVPTGMGTAIPEDAPPAPPENLLPAPELVDPGAGSALRYGNPWFTWKQVAGAASHTLEICKDPRCGQLYRRVLGLNDARWRSEVLPKGTFYWRATAVSPSGLDGYPSQTSAFEILFSGPDSFPPTGAVSIAGTSIAAGGVTYYDRSARLAVSMTDAESGLASWTAQVDGRELGESELAGPWGTGTHIASAKGVDLDGNRGETASLEFEVDAEGPELEIRLGGATLLEEKLGSSSMPRRWRRRLRRWVEERAGSAGYKPVWTVLAAESEDNPLSAREGARTILTREHSPESAFAMTGNHPGILLLLAGGVGGGTPNVTIRSDNGVAPEAADGSGLTESVVVWIEARDGGVDRVTRLRLDTETRSGAEPGAPPESYLTLETEDAFGNRSEGSIRLLPPPRPPAPGPCTCPLQRFSS